MAFSDSNGPSQKPEADRYSASDHHFRPIIFSSFSWQSPEAMQSRIAATAAWENLLVNLVHEHGRNSFALKVLFATANELDFERFFAGYEEHAIYEARDILLRNGALVHDPDTGFVNIAIKYRSFAANYFEAYVSAPDISFKIDRLPALAITDVTSLRYPDPELFAGRQFYTEWLSMINNLYEQCGQLSFEQKALYGLINAGFGEELAQKNPDQYSAAMATLSQIGFTNEAGALWPDYLPFAALSFDFYFNYRKNPGLQGHHEISANDTIDLREELHTQLFSSKFLSTAETTDQKMALHSMTPDFSTAASSAAADDSVQSFLEEFKHRVRIG